jgi:putative NIF3 family GTP cyclohydrolase 1 type 2
VNDELAKFVGIGNPEPFAESGQEASDVFPMGRMGFLEKPCSMQDFLKKVKSALNTEGLRYLDAGRDVSKVAVMGGTGGSQFGLVLENGCDTFVTADIKYDQFLDARELGMNLVDAGHFDTENVIIPPLAEKLRTEFPQVGVKVSARHKQVIRFY